MWKTSYVSLDWLASYACYVCITITRLGPSVHSYALVGVHICTNYALVTGGQDGVWGRFLDSGHKLEKVLEKILLVECKSAADEKSKEWQWGLFNKVKLPQQNLFVITTFCMLYCCILEYKYIRSPNTFGVQLPVSQYMSGLFDRPAPIHLWDHNPCQHFQRNRSCLKEGATNCTCILILFFGICV